MDAVRLLLDNGMQRNHLRQSLGFLAQSREFICSSSRASRLGQSSGSELIPSTIDTETWNPKPETRNPKARTLCHRPDKGPIDSLPVSFPPSPSHKHTRDVLVVVFMGFFSCRARKGAGVNGS